MCTLSYLTAPPPGYDPVTLGPGAVPQGGDRPPLSFAQTKTNKQTKKRKKGKREKGEKKEEKRGS